MKGSSAGGKNFLVKQVLRFFPIEAAYIGRTLQTKPQEMIEVRLSETDNTEKVLLAEREPAGKKR